MKKILWFVSVFAFISCIFAGCKSAPKIVEDNEVHPLALLDQDASIYVCVPVSNHKNLVSSLLMKQIEGLSESNAMSLAERTGNMYVSLGTVKDRSRLQIAALASIPKIAVSSAFKKKNGWQAVNVTFAEKPFVYYKHVVSVFQVSLPSSKILCAGQNVEPLIQRYAQKSEIPVNPVTEWINAENKSNDILFYITRPGQYLRNLIGQSINVGADAAYGKLIYIPNKKNLSVYSGKYELVFNLHLTDKKAADSFKGLLNLSFSMMGGTVRMIDERTIQLSGVEVSQHQIEDLFLRDPITGKHYKVVNDEVVEEKY